MQRKAYIDYSRALGILAVVWVHVSGSAGGSLRASTSALTDFLMTTSYVPLLFLVSGGLASGYIEKSDVSFSDCAIKFFKGILVPFYSLSLLFFVVNLIAANFISDVPSATEMIVAVLTLRIDDSIPSGVLWFFVTLFF